MRRVGALLGLVVVLLTGCGDDPGVSDPAAAVLTERVAQIRQLAEGRRPEEASAALDELRGTVDVLRRTEEIDADTAREILAAADDVDRQLLLITTTTAPPPQVQDVGGKGKDEDEDDEDDEEDEDEEDEDEEDEDEDD